MYSIIYTVVIIKRLSTFKVCVIYLLKDIYNFVTEKSSKSLYYKLLRSKCCDLYIYIIL